MKKKPTTHKRKPTLCYICGRRVAKNSDNWDHVYQEYAHTRCWFKERGPAAREAGRTGGDNAG